MKSTSFSLNINDALKGLIMGVGTPVILLLQQLIPSWAPFLTAHLGQTGGILVQTFLSALATYLIKNYFTDNNAAAVTTLTTAATQSGEPIVIQPVTPTAPVTATKS